MNTSTELTAALPLKSSFPGFTSFTSSLSPRCRMPPRNSVRQAGASVAAKPALKSVNNAPANHEG